MRYPFAHRTRRIVFLLALFPTATLAYIAMPRGDVRLPAEHARSRTQDIVIGARTPVVPRENFMEVTGSLARTAGARTPADEAAIEELALASGVTPVDLAARLAQRPAAASSNATVATEASARSQQRRRSGGGSGAFAGSGGTAGVGAFGGVSGTARARDDAGTTAVTTTTTTAETTATVSNTTVSTAPTVTVAPTITTRPAATVKPAAEKVEEEIVLENEETPAGERAQNVFGGRDTPPGRGRGLPPGPPDRDSPPSGSPSATPEPISLLLIAGGLAGAYGARRYVS